MLYFYHPCVKPSHQGTVAKSCSQQQVKIGEMWTKWLTNFVICDLSRANGSTSSVWWLILQIIPKEFKKSHCVVVSLQPSETRLRWPLTCIRPSFPVAGYMVQQRNVKCHGAKLLYDCRSCCFFIKTEMFGKYIYTIWNYKFIPRNCRCNHMSLSLKQIQFYSAIVYI